jgi:hypothetical protein
MRPYTIEEGVGYVDAREHAERTGNGPHPRPLSRTR